MILGRRRSGVPSAGRRLLVVALLLLLVFAGTLWAAEGHQAIRIRRHAFLGATLFATSVGITARVLKDVGRSRSGEARVILGAAVLDDVLGLVILAVVTGLIAGAGTGAAFSYWDVLAPLLKAAAFLAGALAVGVLLSRKLFFLGGALIVVAILGKQACSLGVLGRGLDRLTVGIGMIPRAGRSVVDTTSEFHRVAAPCRSARGRHPDRPRAGCSGALPVISGSPIE
jgi:Kef-type K+ transport system membrane component KefB